LQIIQENDRKSQQAIEAYKNYSASRIEANEENVKRILSKIDAICANVTAMVGAVKGDKLNYWKAFMIQAKNGAWQIFLIVAVGAVTLAVLFIGKLLGWW
jgi:hypothetical protein